MIIYLAELSHIGMGRSPNVVPLAAGYVAATAKKCFPKIKIRIFRDPSQLLSAVKIQKPDIVGFSVHLWSERLSNFCAQKIKEISKSTIIVAGGPSVNNIDIEILRFMRLNPFYDVCIPNEGEISFLRLIEHIQTTGKLIKDRTIEGCATIASDNSLIRGKYIMPDLKELPSPYLDGFMDIFLKDGYEPMIQSMRGCPYSCRFCASGTSLWSKLRAFDLNRVFEEFEYVKKHTNSNYLLFTDENFGIMKERDIKIAEYIINSYNNGSFPRRLYFYTAKITTDYVLKVIEILAPLGAFGMSFQTLNESAKKEIRRTNIPYGQFLEYVKWVAQRKIMTSTEMIFGFPRETVDSYLKGIEQLIVSGVDRIYSFNLRLFNGIDLASQESREKYKLKTLYRIPERTYGCYDGNFVVETEEIVVGSESFDYADYCKIRKYGLFLELCCGCGYLTELIKIMRKAGVPGEKIVKFLAEHSFVNYPRLSSIIDKYQTISKAELFDSAEECIEHAQKIFFMSKSLPEVKLNFIYIGKIMLDEEVRKEFIAVIKEFIFLNTDSRHYVNFFSEYLDEIFISQIVLFRKEEKPLITSKSRINLEKIEQSDYDSIDDLFADELITIDFELHEDAVNFLKNKYLGDINDDIALQDIYMQLSRFGLMRKRNCRQ